MGALIAARRAARRGKKPSNNMLAYETQWIDRTVELHQQLMRGTWAPKATTCFIATAPKAREIHAPDFSDRVVHHWLVPQLEAIFEPGFIHDSHSNRKGHGTHTAVDRLRRFVRQVHSGQGGGWYLQLDIHNFFNSIHRPTLWAMLKPKMQRAGLPQGTQRITHALLRHSPQHHGVRHRSTPQQRAAVPAHKRLQNAQPGCGLPIGNLSSQFFANVSLDALDQFCKHTLKIKRYVRYVDDFVIVHHDRNQLDAWRDDIERFLAQRLKLRLKADQRLQPLTNGIDFLGYVIHPTHTLVRRRVVAHCRDKLSTWARHHINASGRITATPDQRAHIRSVIASYAGHFNHANSTRLRADFRRRYPWTKDIAR